MTTQLTVLVVGATGMLGSKIVSALLDQGNVEVRAMVRPSNPSHEKNRKQIDAMRSQGATIVTINDTAQYVAKAVSDPELANTALEVAGDTLTLKQLKAIYEAATNTQLTEKSLGSVTEMQAWITAKKASAHSLEEYVYHQYMYGMVSGKGKLDRLQNDRYPHIKPQTVKQFLSKSAA